MGVPGLVNEEEDIKMEIQASVLPVFHQVGLLLGRSDPLQTKTVSL